MAKPIDSYYKDYVTRTKAPLASTSLSLNSFNSQSPQATSQYGASIKKIRGEENMIVPAMMGAQAGASLISGWLNSRAQNKATKAQGASSAQAMAAERSGELHNRRMQAQEQQQNFPRRRVANAALQWGLKDTGALEAGYFNYRPETWDADYVVNADDGRLARQVETGDQAGNAFTYLSPPQGGGGNQSWRTQYDPKQHQEIEGFLGSNPGDESRIGSALGFGKIGGSSGSTMGSLVGGNRNNSDLVRRPTAPQVDPRPEAYRPEIARPSPRRETAAAPGLAQQDAVRNIRAQQQNRDQEYRNAAAPDPHPFLSRTPAPGTNTGFMGGENWFLDRQDRQAGGPGLKPIPEGGYQDAGGVRRGQIDLSPEAVIRNRERNAMMARGDRRFQDSASNYRTMGDLAMENASPQQMQQMQQMQDQQQMQQMQGQQMRNVSPQQMQQMQMQDQQAQAQQMQQARAQQMRGGQFRGSLPQVPRGLNMGGLANAGRWRA